MPGRALSVLCQFAVYQTVKPSSHHLFMRGNRSINSVTWIGTREWHIRCFRNVCCHRVVMSMSFFHHTECICAFCEMRTWNWVAQNHQPPLCVRWQLAFRDIPTKEWAKDKCVCRLWGIKCMSSRTCRLYLVVCRVSCVVGEWIETCTGRLHIAYCKCPVNV